MRGWVQEFWATFIGSIETKFAAVWIPTLWALMHNLPFDGVAALAGFVVADNILGTVAAFMSATFSFSRWRHSIWKLYTWAMLIVSATLLRSVHGMQGAFILKWCGDYLIFFAILTELVSCMRNLSAVMILQGIRIPGFPLLISALEAINRNSARRMERLLGPTDRITQKLKEDDLDGVSPVDQRPGTQD